LQTGHPAPMNDRANHKLDLDKDALEEADQGFVAAGGNPQERSRPWSRACCAG